MAAVRIGEPDGRRLLLTSCDRRHSGNHEEWSQGSIPLATWKSASNCLFCMHLGQQMQPHSLSSSELWARASRAFLHS